MSPDSDLPRPSRSLPDKPSVDQLRKQAKDLHASGARRTLSAAQLAVARDYGFASWPRLKAHVDLLNLRRLISAGDVAPVRQLLQSSPALSTSAFDDGSTPLHLAAEENRPDMVAVLSEFGATLNRRYPGSAHTALSWAVTCWSFDAAMKLVELGNEPDLFCAAGLGLMDSVRSFWKDGRLVPHPSHTGSSRYDGAGNRLPCPPERDVDHVSDALYIACRANRPDVARWLLDGGADPNWRGYTGANCLAWAEFSANQDLCAMLRDRGGRDDMLDEAFQSTPRVFAFMIYASWGFPKYLLNRLPADPSMANARGGRGTVLHAAAAAGQVRTAEILIRFGADRTTLDPEGRSPADLAALRGHAAVAEILR